MKKTLLMGALVSTLVACKKDDAVVPAGNESELITTVRMTYTNKINNTEKVIATWKDIDGVGGKAPEITTIVLKPNSVYTVSTEFLDESKTTAVNLTTEILKEANDHQVFYTVTGANLTHTYADKDSKGFNLGLQSEHRTTTTSTGKLNVILKHLVGIKTSTTTANQGETDANVEFPVEIK